MPEVVEVCLTSLWLNKKLKGKWITDMNIISGRYKRNTLNGKGIFSKNKPFKIIQINSKGKFLWFELESDKKKYYILNRFGLTGEWSLVDSDHSRIQLVINNKSFVYFNDMRNFGTIQITNNIEDLNYELEKIAPDFLKESFTKLQFYNRIKYYITNSTENLITTRSNQPIIKILMDQTILGSGLGNYLAVEILFRCKVSPHKKLKEFYNDKILSDRLLDAIKYTVKLSYLTSDIGYLEHIDPSMASFIVKLQTNIVLNKNNEYNFLKEVKLKRGDKFTFQVYSQDKDPFGNDIKKDKIIVGRTTYWSPMIQH